MNPHISCTRACSSLVSSHSSHSRLAPLALLEFSRTLSSRYLEHSSEKTPPQLPSVAVWFTGPNAYTHAFPLTPSGTERYGQLMVPPLPLSDISPVWLTCTDMCHGFVLAVIDVLAAEVGVKPEQGRDLSLADLAVRADRVHEDGFVDQAMIVYSPLL